jgi:glycogen(starch) synthase
MMREFGAPLLDVEPLAGRADDEGATLLSSFHIAQHCAGSRGGGMERVVDVLAESLPRCGIGFTGFVAGERGLAASTGGRYHAFAPEDASTLARLRGVRSTLKTALAAQRPDVVAAHFALYTWPVLDLLRQTPLVMHFHGPWAAESRAEGGGAVAGLLKSRLERQVYQRASRVIVLSEAFRRLVIEDYGVAPDCVRIVPGSVDLERFAVPVSRSEARLMLGWPADRPILVTVRRLVARMGLDRLIDAIGLLRASVPDVLLYICGTGRLREALEAQVRGAGLEYNIRFTGFLPDASLPLAYRAADLNVVPTTALEGFGLVAAEAMAAGTPSLVTPVGGLPEIVSDLSPALVFSSTTVTDMAARLHEVLTDKGALPDDAACRRYIATRYSAPLMAARTAAVYREASGS